MSSRLKDLSPLYILAGVFAISVLPFLAVELFHGAIYRIADISSYLVFHNIAEFFSVLVSLSIFGVGWYAYDQSRDRHVLFLSSAFLAIGLMDFMHALSYAGMPDFITVNSANKSTQFWIAVRLFAAIAFLVSAYVYPDTERKWLSRQVLLSIALAVSAVVFAGVIFFRSRLPATFIEGVGLTPFKKVSEYMIIGLLALTCIAYWRRLSKTGEKLLLYYIAAFIICIFSELVFAVYKSVFDTFNVLGHVYKIAAFYLIYKGIFAASVKAPYARLAETSQKLHMENVERTHAEEELKSSAQQWRTTFDAISDGVCLLDQEYSIVRCNTAMAELLGKPEREIRGKKCFELIHGTLSNVGNCPLQKALASRKREALTLPLKERWFNVTVDPLLDEYGGLSGAVHIMTDVTQDKKIEEKMRYIAAYNRNLIETSLDPLVTIGPDGRITDVNGATEEATGVPRESLIGTDFSDYFTAPEDARSGYEQVFKEGFVRDYPLEIKHRDGQTTSVLYNAAVYKDEAGRVLGVFAAARDITHHKRVEEALRTERQRLLNVLDNMPMMVCLITRDYHVPFANRAFRERFGESESRRCYEYCFGKKEPCDFCEASEVLTTGKPHRWEAVAPDGASIIDIYEFPFKDVDGTPMILEVDVDITEGKLAEEKLRRSEKDLREAQRIAHVGSWKLDPNSGHVIWSEEIARIFGLDPVLPAPEYSDLFHYLTEDSAARMDAAIKKTLESGEPYEVDLEVIRVDGTRRWINSKGEVDLDDGKRVTGLRGTAIDITIRKESEEELRQRLEELERFRDATIQREFRIRDLKDLVKELEGRLRSEQSADIV